MPKPSRQMRAAKTVGVRGRLFNSPQIRKVVVHLYEAALAPSGTTDRDIDSIVYLDQICIAAADHRLNKKSRDG